MKIFKNYVITYTIENEILKLKFKGKEVVT